MHNAANDNNRLMFILCGFEPYFWVALAAVISLSIAIAWPYGWSAGTQEANQEISAITANYMMESANDR